MTIFMQSSFDVSRKKAADMLKVSTRTLDRYIKKKILSSKSVAGRIFVNRQELNDFAKKKRKHRSIKKTTTSYINSIQNDEVARYKAEFETYRSRIEQLETQLESAVSPEKYSEVNEKMQKERFNKWVLYVLITVLLLAQPVWLILVYL